MIISQAKYYKNIEGNSNEGITATIDDTSMSVPLDPDNRHQQAVLEWAKIDGNTIEDAD